MRTLSFIVAGQKLERDPACDFSGIVSNSQGYLYARFRFSADWKQCKKVAIFTGTGRECFAPLKGDLCEIPAQALTGNTVQVCVVGQRDNIRIPTNVLEFKQHTGH